jgi:hypothetical protein
MRSYPIWRLDTISKWRENFAKELAEKASKGKGKEVDDKDMGRDDDKDMGQDDDKDEDQGDDKDKVKGDDKRGKDELSDSADEKGRIRCVVIRINGRDSRMDSCRWCFSIACFVKNCFVFNVATKDY